MQPKLTLTHTLTDGFVLWFTYVVISMRLGRRPGKQDVMHLSCARRALSLTQCT